MTQYTAAVTPAYAYHVEILQQLARHGLQPKSTTSPQQLRDIVRDLYKYEIKNARTKLLAGQIERRDYAGHIIELRKRYWLLSLPVELWTARAQTSER